MEPGRRRQRLLALPTLRVTVTAASARLSASRIQSLSVVLPAYNEAENVASAVSAVLSELDLRGIPGEVIVVDDGSSDETAHVVAGVAARDARVRGVSHPSNLGYGAALMRGIRESRCEHIFFTDADLQFDVSELDRLEVHADRYDIIVGYRQVRADPLYRRLNAWAWNFVVNKAFGLEVRDVDCAFKVFHRRVFDSIGIESAGAFVNSEILARARAEGFTVKEVAVSHYPRKFGVQTGARLRVIGRAWVELGRLYGDLRR